MPILSLKSPRIGDENLSDLLPPKKHLFYSNGLMLYIGALLVITSLNISGRSWSLFGFDWIEYSDNIVYLSIALLMFYFVDHFISLNHKGKEESTLEGMESIIPVNWGEFKHYIFLAVAAGICEEIIFRGFLINYFIYHFEQFSFGMYLAILIPAIAFSVSHLYQGWVAVLKIVIVAILFGLIFVLSKSLIIPILLHIFIDLFSGVSAVYFFNKKEKIDTYEEQDFQ